MSKRRDSLKDLLTPIKPAEFSGENSGLKSRTSVASGALLSMNEALSGLATEADELRKAVASGLTIVELDPSRIDVSFVRDRLDDYSGEEFDSLVASLAEQGQAIPVLVRPHPDKPGRYQLAFGHRRVAALRVLNKPVKALVREMSDEDLVVAQGNENLERKDLSFIERAMFAYQLEERGMSRAVIMSTFGTSSKGVLSEMIGLARRLPRTLVHAIGPAQKIGRPRWITLAEMLNHADDGAWRDLIESAQFKSLSSNDRFEAVLRAVRSKRAATRPLAITWKTDDGTAMVRKNITERAVTMNFSEREGKRFGEWIASNLDRFYDTYLKEAEEKKD